MLRNQVQNITRGHQGAAVWIAAKAGVFKHGLCRKGSSRLDINSAAPSGETSTKTAVDRSDVAVSAFFNDYCSTHDCSPVGSRGRDHAETMGRVSVRLDNGTSIMAL